MLCVEKTRKISKTDTLLRNSVAASSADTVADEIQTNRVLLIWAIIVNFCDNAIIYPHTWCIICFTTQRVHNIPIGRGLFILTNRTVYDLVYAVPHLDSTRDKVFEADICVDLYFETSKKAFTSCYNRSILKFSICIAGIFMNLKYNSLSEYLFQISFCNLLFT